ncbi:MAG: family hydrolase [Firmicutes bacterium]|nr:family hydrolase [Bacillota bacterium]
MPLGRIKTIFFDYDGTLHNGIKIYAPAFRDAYAYLVENSYAEPRDWTEAEISYWLGFSPMEMWKRFMPGIPEETKITCSGIISSTMKALTEGGKAELYRGSIEVLSYLKEKGYHLIFISNCKSYYKEAHNRIFGLDNYFEELIATEDYGYLPKDEILASIKHRYEKDIAIVGDRFQDIEAGKANGILTIGCTYGYGSASELEDADIRIGDILELKKLL